MTRKILIQLDSDVHPSSFDAVVAVDAGADFLFQYGAITADNVEGLVHGAMFTRGPDELQNTAIFIGGSNVLKGEAILKKIKKTLFDPLKVSVVLDCNGCNSTASAAVVCAMRHSSLSGVRSAVLGATGAVGQRVAQLLASEGSHVAVGSRELAKSNTIAEQIQSDGKNAKVTAFDYSDKSIESALDGCEVLFACGAAGVELLDEKRLNSILSLKVAVDLNAVPPLGLGGINVTDKAVARNGRTDYGALGVGGLKMKIHKAAIRTAFEKRGEVLNAAEMFAIGKTI